ncbi:hypothetical protein ACVW1A_000384 [Bradyrhizobium sp. LB1.3]
MCLIAVITTGAVSGLFIGKEWFSYFRHAFQYGFLFAFYLFGRELALRPIPRISIKLISVTILLGYAIATILYAATPGLHSGGYSFQPNLALLPVASSLSSGNWLGALAGTSIIVIGNKRAVYVGLAIMLATYLAFRVSRRWQLRLFARFVLVGITAPVIRDRIRFCGVPTHIVDILLSDRPNTHGRRSIHSSADVQCRYGSKPCPGSEGGPHRQVDECQKR